MVSTAIGDEADFESGLAQSIAAVPGMWGYVKRPQWVKVKAQDRNGNWFEVEGEDLTARCFCHELDHLDGVLFTSRAERMLTDEEMESGSYMDEE